MSWRDRFNARGSFRGAPFVLRDDSLQFGRRVQVHEYPERDIPYAEDLGRRARQFTIDVYVIGENYDRERDALINAIEQPGPGTLVHPRHGTMRVSIVDARKSESTREGGLCRFSLTCVEAGEAKFPSTEIDTAETVEADADTAIEAAQATFAVSYSVTGQSQFFVDAIDTEVSRVFSDVANVVGDVTGPIATAIRQPVNMASAIVDGVGAIGRAIAEPVQALRLYERMFTAGVGAPAIPLTTGNRQRQAANTDAVHKLVQRTAVIEAARQTSRMDYASRDEALAIRDKITDALETQMEAVDAVTGAPIDNDLYRELASLRAAVVADIRERGTRLPRVDHITLRHTMPALVVAHRVYNDPSRAAEIVRRNHIRHPGFVPGGEPIEVLRDV